MRGLMSPPRIFQTILSKPRREIRTEMMAKANCIRNMFTYHHR